MKETQEPDKSAFDELSLNREFQVPEGLEMDGAFICKFMRVIRNKSSNRIARNARVMWIRSKGNARVTRDMTCIVTRKIQF